MARQRKTVATPRSEAKLYLAKAGEFGGLARTALVEAHHDAAMLNAIHAAITAVDAVTVALAGRRSAEPDHLGAVDLLEQVGGASPEVKTRGRQLRTLLAKKNAVEYESRRANAREARDAVERSDRLIGWARQVVEAAKI